MTASLQRPIVTVDIVLLTRHDGGLRIALQKRRAAPFASRLALIGGYVHADEDASATEAARRVLREKAQTEVRVLDQLATFSGPDRDPRGWSASIVYYALTPVLTDETIAACGLSLAPMEAVGDLPFDHDAIVSVARERWRRRAAYSTLPAFLLEQEFTFLELRTAYQLVLGRGLNDSAFRRKVDELRLIEPVGEAKSKRTDRPAQLYKLLEPRIVEFDRTL